MIKRRNITIDEINYSDMPFSSSFVTLDGYVYDAETNSFSYDNDYDSTVPAIVYGVKNPSAEDRQKSTNGRKFFLPRQLKPIRVKPIQFWEKGSRTLSELESVYPQISIRLKGIGSRKANEFLNLLVYLHLERNQTLKDIPLGEQLRETMEKRARAHQYQGKWKLLSKLLQVEYTKAAFAFVLHEYVSERSIRGNMIPNGATFYSSLKVVLDCKPVTNPKRKRGYADKHSRRLEHEIHELIERTREEVIWTRENLIPETPKKRMVSFLYGNSNPARIVVNEDEEVTAYRKRINRQIKELKQQEKQRIKEMTGPVIIIQSKEQKSEE